MSTTPVLKIAHNNNTVLLSTHVEQSISSFKECKVMYNIHNKIINYPYTGHFKCTIATPDAPDMSMLHVGEMYKIYSVIEFKNSHKPEKDYIVKSLSERNSLYIYRPILEMVLTDFESVYSDAHCKWTIHFEA